MNWYKQTFKTAKDLENPRFCNGRMSLIEFICLHIFIVVNTAVLVVLPLLYFTIIPAKLQEMLDAPASSDSVRNPIRISRVAVGPFGEQGFKVDMSLALNPLIQFPVYAGIGDVNVRVTHQNTQLFLLHVPGGSAWLNRPNGIQPSFAFSWNDQEQTNTHSFLASFSNDTLVDKKVVLYFCPEIKLYTMTLYPSLCLHYTTLLDSIKPRLEALPPSSSSAAVASPKSSFIFEAPDTKSALDTLTANFGIDELSSLSADFKFMWKKLYVSSTDDTISFEFVAEFVNPTVFELALIERLDFFGELMGTKIVKVSIFKLGLSPALNNAFDMRIDLTFLGDSLDPHNTQAAIENASKLYAEKQDFEVAIAGPFKITKAGFARSITEHFRYSASFKDTMSYIYSHSENADSLTVSSLMDNSNMSISILPDQIDAFLDIQVPGLSSLKPPLNYSFPFFVGFDLYGGDSLEKVLQTKISPIVLQKSPKGFGIRANASIIPVNTQAAAAGLASAVNPILSRSPTPSKIGLKDFFLSVDGSTPFLWCKEVFGERVLSFGLTPLNKSSWSTSFLSNGNSSSNGTLLVSSLDGVVDVSQLNDKPGFQAVGNVRFKYPSTLPILKIDLGYLGVQTTVESTPFALLELPTGLLFSPSQTTTRINAMGSLSRSSDLSPKLQKLADYFSSTGAAPAFAGVTDFTFGSSPSSRIITFSQIVYEVNPMDYISSQSSSSSLLPAGALKLETGDVKVRSASTVFLSTTGTFDNPFPCNIAIGALSFGTTLDDKSLVSVSLPQLKIVSGKAPLTIEMELTSNTFADEALAEKVGKVYETLYNGGQDSFLAGINNILLIPSSPSSSAARIDQFQSVTLKSRLSHPSNSAKSALDYSSLFLARSNSPIISSIQQLSVKAEANQNLLVGTQFSYANPYPLSVDIPYLAVSSRLNKQILADLELSSLNLVNSGKGNMSPRVQLAFKSQPGLPDSFAKFYSALSSGKDVDASDRFVVSGIQFGSSGVMRKNVLLSKIPFDGTSALIKYFKYNGDTSSSSSVFGDNFGASFDFANLYIRPSDKIGFEAGSSVASSVVLDVDIPYLSVMPGVDSVSVGTLRTSLNANGPKGNAAGELHLNDSDELADSFAKIFNSYQASHVTPVRLLAANLVLGQSEADSIDLFSKVSLEYGIKDVSALGPFSSNTPASTSSFRAANTNVSVAPARTLLIDSNVEFSSSYKISVSGLGFAAADVGVDEVMVAQVSGSGKLDIAADSTNTMNPSVRAIFPSSSTIQDKVASFGNNLWNNYGKTTEKLFGTGILFGNSEGDYIKAFSKLTVLVDSAKWLGPSIKNSTTIVEPSLGPQFSLSRLDLLFNPSNMINAAVQGSFNISYQVSTKLPFFSFGSDLEESHFFDVNLNGISLSGGRNKLNVSSEISLQDNDVLSTRIALLFQEYNSADSTTQLSGSLGTGFFKFGVDDHIENVIDTFAKVRLNLQLEELRKQFSPAATSNSSIFKDVNFETDNIQLSLLPARNMAVKFGASFNSSFPVSIQGLGLVSSRFAIDNVPSVTLGVNGVTINPGSNQLDINSNIAFETGDAVATSFSKLYDAYMNRSSISSTLMATGTVFGFNSQHAFSLFSKCTFNGTSTLKSFLAPAEESLPTKPLFSEYRLPKLHLNALSTGEVALDIGARLKNVSRVFGGQIGFVQFNSLLDSQEFGRLSLLNLTVAPQEHLDLSLQFSAALLFDDEEKTQQLLSDTFDKYWNKQTINNSIFLSGFLIGFDEKRENLIDAFSKIKFEKTVSSLLDDKGSKNSTLLPAGFTYNLTSADLDLFDSSTLTSKMTASIDFGPDFHTDFDVSLPYFSASMMYNQSDFVTLTVSDMAIDTSNASAVLFLKSHGNKPAWNSLVYTAGLVVNDRVSPIPDLLRFNSLSFGHSASTSTNTFSKISIAEPMNNVTARFSGASNHTTLLELHIELHPQGMLTDVLTTIDFPNFRTDLDIEFKSHFQAKQTGPAYPYATYKITDFSLPTSKMIVEPIMTNFSASVALKNYISVFATDYLTQDSRYGFATITSKAGHVFRDLDEAYMYGPKGSDWAPYVVDIVPPNDWTWDVEHAGYLNGPFNIKGRFHNFGVTHFDIGDVYCNINVSGKPLVTIETVQPLRILNYREGGAAYEQAKFPLMGEIGILWPKEYYGDFWFAKVLGALYDARQNPSHVTFEYGFKRNGNLIPYMNQVLDNMPAKAQTNSSFSICDLLAVMRLEIWDKPDWQYPLLVPFEHSINNLFLHCDFSVPVAPVIPLQRFLTNLTLVNSKLNKTNITTSTTDTAAVTPLSLNISSIRPLTA